MTIPQRKKRPPNRCRRQPLQTPRISVLVVKQLHADLVLLAHRVLAYDTSREARRGYIAPEPDSALRVRRPLVITTPARTARQELRRRTGDSVFEFLATQLCEDETSRRCTDHIEWLRHRRQRRQCMRTDLQSVEPHDGKLFGHPDAQVRELCHAADCVAIRCQDQRCDGHRRGDELVGHVAATELAVVEGIEEPLRVRLDALSEHRQAIGLVTLAHVGLDEIGCEADSTVTVADQMVDCLGDAHRVVGCRRWHGESFDLIAGKGDGLPRSLQTIEVVALRRRRNRDDPVEVIPSGRLAEVGRRHNLITAKPGVEGLDQDDMAANCSELTGDPRHDVSVVEPTGHRREHPNRDGFPDAGSLRRQRREVCRPGPSTRSGRP